MEAEYDGKLYLYATNIDGTKETGIVVAGIGSLNLLCLCPEENAAIILQIIKEAEFWRQRSEIYENNFNERNISQ